MQGRDHREKKPIEYFHADVNNDEIKKRIYEQDMRDAEKQDKEDALAQRRQDAADKKWHKAYKHSLMQDIANNILYWI